LPGLLLTESSHTERPSGTNGVAFVARTEPSQSPAPTPSPAWKPSWTTPLPVSRISLRLSRGNSPRAEILSTHCRSCARSALPSSDNWRHLHGDPMTYLEG